MEYAKASKFPGAPSAEKACMTLGPASRTIQPATSGSVAARTPAATVCNQSWIGFFANTPSRQVANAKAHREPDLSAIRWSAWLGPCRVS
jgi:hypothetical protein